MMYACALISTFKKSGSVCVLLTVLSSWRSCWLRLDDSCSLASRAAIFSSLNSKDDFRVDSSLVSRSLNLEVKYSS